MTRYVLATQQPWGVKVFDQIRASRGNWRLVQTKEEMCWPLQVPRYMFCLNWSSYVPPDILAMAEVVNFHCTALPYGRGGAPIENLLLRGYTETVITAHRMVEELDAGPIYSTRGPVSLVRYVAKPDTWFDVGTEASRLTDAVPGSGLYAGVRVGKPDEETCLDDEFDVQPCAKEQILERFIAPCVDLIRWIVETEPEPYPQVGEVTTFTRLDKAAYSAFWKDRA